eukprot:g5782.t1
MAGARRIVHRKPRFVKDVHQHERLRGDLLEAIDQAEFVAFDLELTGLHKHASRFVGVDRCYEAHAQGAGYFMPVQMGLCFARRVSVEAEAEAGPPPGGAPAPGAAEPPVDCSSLPREQQRIVWQFTPVSIYLFPHGAQNQRNILMSSATVKFLSENGFSFDTWVRKGLSWMRPGCEKKEVDAVQTRIDEIEQLRKNLRSQQQAQMKEKAAGAARAAMEESPVHVPEGPDKAVVDGVREKIRVWVNKPMKPIAVAFTESLIFVVGDPSSPDQLEIPMENAFQRLLLHTVIAQEFPQVYSQSTRNENGRFLSVYKSEADVYDGQLKHLQKEIDVIKRKRGVRELLDAISKSGKLLVGHNCFYDICHVYQTFFDDLPLGGGGGAASENEMTTPVEDFKRRWLSLFPKTVDTKYMSDGHELLSVLSPPSSLPDLCDFMVSSCASKSLKFAVSSSCTSSSGAATLVAPGAPAPADGGYALPYHFQKYMTTLQSSGNGSQGGQRVVEQQQQQEPARRGTNMSDFSTHDAGYDSLLTAVVFLFQANYILEKKALSWADIPHIEQLFQYSLNKIRLVRTQPNMIDLAAKESTLDTQNAVGKRHFFMQGYPKGWQRWEIMRVWSPVTVTIAPVSDDSCWVIVRTDEDAENIHMIWNIIQANSAGGAPKFSLLTYEEYSKTKARINAGLGTVAGAGTVGGGVPMQQVQPSDAPPPAGGVEKKKPPAETSTSSFSPLLARLLLAAQSSGANSGKHAASVAREWLQEVDKDEHEALFDLSFLLLDVAESGHLMPAKEEFELIDDLVDRCVRNSVTVTTTGAAAGAGGKGGSSVAQAANNNEIVIPADDAGGGDAAVGRGAAHAAAAHLQHPPAQGRNKKQRDRAKKYYLAFLGEVFASSSVAEAADGHNDTYPAGGPAVTKMKKRKAKGELQLEASDELRFSGSGVERKSEGGAAAKHSLHEQQEKMNEPLPRSVLLHSLCTLLQGFAEKSAVPEWRRLAFLGLGRVLDLAATRADVGEQEDEIETFYFDRAACDDALAVNLDCLELVANLLPRTVEKFEAALEGAGNDEEAEAEADVGEDDLDMPHMFGGASGRNNKNAPPKKRRISQQERLEQLECTLARQLAVLVQGLLESSRVEVRVAVLRMLRGADTSAGKNMKGCSLLEAMQRLYSTLNVGDLMCTAALEEDEPIVNETSKENETSKKKAAKMKMKSKSSAAGGSRGSSGKAQDEASKRSAGKSASRSVLEQALRCFFVAVYNCCLEDVEFVEDGKIATLASSSFSSKPNASTTAAEVRASGLTLVSAFLENQIDPFDADRKKPLCDLIFCDCSLTGTAAAKLVWLQIDENCARVAEAGRDSARLLYMILFLESALAANGGGDGPRALDMDPSCLVHRFAEHTGARPGFRASADLDAVMCFCLHPKKAGVTPAAVTPLRKFIAFDLLLANWEHAFWRSAGVEGEDQENHFVIIPEGGGRADSPPAIGDDPPPTSSDSTRTKQNAVKFLEKFEEIFLQTTDEYNKQKQSTSTTTSTTSVSAPGSQELQGVLLAVLQKILCGQLSLQKGETPICDTDLYALVRTVIVDHVCPLFKNVLAAAACATFLQLRDHTAAGTTAARDNVAVQELRCTWAALADDIGLLSEASKGTGTGAAAGAAAGTTTSACSTSDPRNKGSGRRGSSTSSAATLKTLTHLSALSAIPRVGDTLTVQKGRTFRTDKLVDMAVANTDDRLTVLHCGVVLFNMYAAAFEGLGSASPERLKKDLMTLVEHVLCKIAPAACSPAYPEKDAAEAEAQRKLQLFFVVLWTAADVEEAAKTTTLMSSSNAEFYAQPPDVVEKMTKQATKILADGLAREECVAYDLEGFAGALDRDYWRKNSSCPAPAPRAEDVDAVSAPVQPASTKCKHVGEKKRRSKNGFRFNDLLLPMKRKMKGALFGSNGGNCVKIFRGEKDLHGDRADAERNSIPVFLSYFFAAAAASEDRALVAGEQQLTTAEALFQLFSLVVAERTSAPRSVGPELFRAFLKEALDFPAVSKFLINRAKKSLPIADLLHDAFFPVLREEYRSCLMPLEPTTSACSPGGAAGAGGAGGLLNVGTDPADAHAEKNAGSPSPDDKFVNDMMKSKSLHSTSSPGKQSIGAWSTDCEEKVADLRKLASAWLRVYGFQPPKGEYAEFYYAVERELKKAVFFSKNKKADAGRVQVLGSGVTTGTAAWKKEKQARPGEAAGADYAHLDAGYLAVLEPFVARLRDGEKRKLLTMAEQWVTETGVDVHALNTEIAGNNLRGESPMISDPNGKNASSGVVQNLDAGMSQLSLLSKNNRNCNDDLNSMLAPGTSSSQHESFGASVFLSRCRGQEGEAANLLNAMRARRASSSQGSAGAAAAARKPKDTTGGEGAAGASFAFSGPASKEFQDVHGEPGSGAGESLFGGTSNDISTSEVVSDANLLSGLKSKKRARAVANGGASFAAEDKNEINLDLDKSSSFSRMPPPSVSMSKLKNRGKMADAVASSVKKTNTNSEGALPDLGSGIPRPPHNNSASANAAATSSSSKKRSRGNNELEVDANENNDVSFIDEDDAHMLSGFVRFLDPIPEQSLEEDYSAGAPNKNVGREQEGHQSAEVVNFQYLDADSFLVDDEEDDLLAGDNDEEMVVGSSSAAAGTATTTKFKKLAKNDVQKANGKCGGGR